MIIIFTTYLYHYYKYLKRGHNLNGQTSHRHLNATHGEVLILKWRKMCHVLTMITLFTYCIQGLNYCFNSWSIYSSLISCNIYQKLSVWLYHFGKFCLYIILVLRIKVVFNESTFHQFVDKMVRIMYVLLAIFIIVATIGDLWTITATKQYTTNRVFYCMLDDLVIWGLTGTDQSLYQLHVFIEVCTNSHLTGFVIGDIIISVLCLILFNYPLNQLIKECEIEDLEIIQLTKKYAILTTTAIGMFCVCCVAQKLFII